MRIDQLVRFLTALAFLTMLNSCTFSIPDDPVSPSDTLNPQPSPRTGNIPPVGDQQVTQFPPLSPGVQEISGRVLRGGDQSPQGLLDGPRQFTYQVALDSGEEITVTYTAYPPSPSVEGDPKPQLRFHAGTILPGDRLRARGTYQPGTNTLTVEADTDFIETLVE